jgi:large repetitive protein
MSTLVVTNLNDDNSAGSLRSQIAASQSGDTIAFDPSLVGGTLLLAQGELAVTHALTIEGDVDGNATPDITIDANGASGTRVFNVDAVTATLDGLVITGGNSTYGAGIVTAGGTDLTVRNSTITDNHVGGGIRNVGTLTLDHVTVSGNTSDGDGGGIANLALSNAVLHVVDSTIANNTAAFNGGGLKTEGGASATLTNVTMFGNNAGGSYGGGAIYAGGDLTLTQVTITGNHADGAGGGLYIGLSHTPTITNSIIAGNNAGSGSDDIFAPGTVNYTGVNVVGTGSDTDASDHVIQAPALGDLFAQIASVDPDNNPATANSFQAGALSDNGGPVKTVAINPTGIAHDTGSDAAAVYDDDGNPATLDVAIPTDARGLARVAGAHVDIGAFEQQAGQSFVVTTLADQLDSSDPHATLLDFGGAGDLSLREALVLAQQDPTSIDTITFDPSLVGGSTPGVDDGHLTLTNGELVVFSNVSIDGDVDGNGTPDVTIDADGASNTRVLNVSADVVTLDGLVITGGNSIYGAGIVTAAGTDLTVRNSTITDNHVGSGIRNVGTLTLDHVTVSGNTSDADGGGIVNALSGAALHVIDSTIANNTAAFNGGGLVNTGGNSATLTNVTMYGNSAHGTIGGGAIYSGGDLTLTQVTITGNHADTNGGGLYIGPNSATITNSIIAGNDAGGVSDDIIAFSPVNYAGANVIGTGSDADGSDHVIQTPTLGDLFAQVSSIDPDNNPATANSFQAGALADNGGPVKTVAINPTGIAHDAGSDAAAVYDDDANPATPDVAIPADARDLGRISGAHVDIGAFEQQAAQSFVVTTLADQLDSNDPHATLLDFGGASDLSLREALFLANEDPTTADTITFDPSLGGGTLHLNMGMGELVVAGNVTVDGDTNGDNRTDIQIDGNLDSRVFHVTAGTSTFHAVTVSGGRETAGYGGGFAIDAGATVTIADSIVANNHVSGYGGGGIANDGTLNLTNSFLAANTTAYSGGGLYNHGTASLTNTTLYANSAYTGGGIFNAAGSDLHVIQSTLTGNYAGMSGGGIYAAGSPGTPGHFVLTNSIVAGNAAVDGTTGDLYVATGADNTHTGINLFLQAGAGNAQDITATDLHDVFAGVATSLFTNVESGQPADNGGPVPTVGIKTGGLAHNAGDDSAVPVDLLTDARDQPREAGTHVDIGAIELQPGQSFVVTTLADELDSTNPHATLANFGGPTDLSLREALVLAQQDPTSPDTITFAASLVGGSHANVDDGHLTLTNGSLIVLGNVTIDGDVNGDHAPDITLDGDGSSNVLAVAGGTSTLNGLTIENGNSLYGGGLIVGSYSGFGATTDVTLSNSIVRDSSALYGGGIAVGYGALHLVNTTVSGNHAGIGGGIAVNGGGTLTALNTTISGNDAAFAFGYGGGLANAGSSTLIDSTVSGNHAIAGGGIYTSSDLTLVNTTVANNQATYGGGLYTTPCGCATATLTNSTVTGNYATYGGGIYHSAGTLNLTNSIVAGNGAHDGPDLFALGTVNYAGVNIFSQSDVGQPGVDIYEPNPGNIFATLVTIDPDGTPNSGDEFVAGALANNGGMVQTVAINPTGTARDAGSDADAVYDDDANPATPDVAIPTDARGLDRTVGAHVDIGAFEAQPAAPTDIALSPASVPENSANGTVVGALSDTDTDPGDSATYTLIDDVGGRFAISGSDLVVADGTKLDFETDTSHQVTVRVTDGGGLTFDKVLSIGVTNVNEAPVAANGAASGNEDTTIAGALAATDVDSASLTFSRVADAAHGSVTVNADGTFSYTPNADFNGADSFTYKANDGALDSNVATVTLTVGAVNDAPSFTKGADQVSNEDAGAQAIAGWASAISAGPADEAGQAVAFVVSSNSNAGLFSAAPTIAPDGTLTYTAAANASGSATITVHAHDSGGTANGGVDSSADQSFTITIDAVNDAPVAASGAASGSEDTVITGTLSASDIDSASLTYSRVANAAHGSVTVNADGTFSYTPNADFNGNDSFTYKANDGALDSNIATVTLTVGAVNDAPSFTKGADQVSNEDAGAQAVAGWASAISAGPADEAGQAVAFVVSSNSNPGLFAAAPSIAADGTLTYTAAANANGSATITVHAHDTGGTANGGVDSSADQTFTITVNPVDDAPVAANGAASGNEDTVITGILAATDIDSASLAYSRVANAAHGSVTVHADGTFSYTPNPDFNGNDSFTYKANDGTLDSNVATVSLTINPVNDAPVAANGAASGNEDTAITGTLSASDIDSASLTYSRVANAAHGSVTVHTDGTFSYTPNADFNGIDSFTYKANDGALDSNVATVSLTINPVNDAPVAANGAASGNEGTVITGTLSANDIDSASLTYSAGLQPAHGILMVHTDGTFSYTPDAGFSGADSFSFKANDGALDSNVATESLTVNPLNHAPVAVNGAAIGNEDAAVAGTVSATDIDHSQLTYALVGANGGAAHGSVVFNPSGSFVYTPAHDFNGSDSFSFKANDGTLDSNAATESLTVNAVNDAPVNTVPGPLSVESGLDALIKGLAVHDIDAASLTTSLHVDHGTLAVGSAGGAAVTGSGTATVTLIGSVAQIDATLGAANNVIYHSALNFIGTDHLTFTSNDGGSSGAGGPLSDTDIVDINVGSSSFAPPHLAYSDFHLG